MKGFRRLLPVLPSGQGNPWRRDPLFLSSEVWWISLKLPSAGSFSPSHLLRAKGGGEDVWEGFLNFSLQNLAAEGRGRFWGIVPKRAGGRSNRRLPTLSSDAPRAPHETDEGVFLLLGESFS